VSASACNLSDKMRHAELFVLFGSLGDDGGVFILSVVALFWTVDVAAAALGVLVFTSASEEEEDE